MIAPLGATMAAVCRGWQRDHFSRDACDAPVACDVRSVENEDAGFDVDTGNVDDDSCNGCWCDAVVLGDCSFNPVFPSFKRCFNLRQEL